jgi:glycosyltransferase involved in cell wall biosynthesis
MRLACIVSRYGPHVLGGAETLARAIAEHLGRRDHYVEVWTTCAQSLYSWVNEYPAGVEQHNGITVRRFPVHAGHPFDLLAEPLSLENQYRWVDTLAHSPQLYAHIMANGPDFDFLIFMPYAVGTTMYGASIYPHKSIVWTCLHDELAAYLHPTRRLLASATGLIFNTLAEQEFIVKRLRIKHPRTIVAGMGFDILAGDAVTFRQTYPQIAERFFIYAGRLEEGKNVDMLIQYFVEYRSRHSQQLDLVLLGDGPVGKMNRAGIIPLGFVDEATKRDALAAATFLCQPSVNESFGIVLMEAWSQRRPVLVHEHCPVTVTHVRQAQGGLYFANYSDFEGAVEYFLARPDQANQMGTNGYMYVRQNYNWELITNRLEQALFSWLEQA